MVFHFLYCIDYPAKAEGITTTDRIDGWLLCQQKIISVSVVDETGAGRSIGYGHHRPDVAEIFRSFSDNEYSGFRILQGNQPLALEQPLPLELAIVTGDGRSKILRLNLDLTPSLIQDIEVDEEEPRNLEIFEKTEKSFINTLQRKPWLTIRMDLTNKCNLKCVMCHYKEQEIWSRPLKQVSAEQLKLALKDIGPYVKHIMLSCGFEPLMSKHFHEIIAMLRTSYPHMEIGMCTNGMLMNDKVRKTIIEKNVTHVILSFDGVTKPTLERIRAGASFDKILGNIKALNALKIKHHRSFPLMFMDFVMMHSNIHEAPAFVEMCAALGIGMIDFRHMVGNIYFSDDPEMLVHHQAEYNFYRQRILEASKKFNMDVRLPEAFPEVAPLNEAPMPDPGLDDFRAVQPDPQVEEIINPGEVMPQGGKDNDFSFLFNATCLRPFNEIMIVDQQKVLPCSYYSDPMGDLEKEETLYSIFFSEKFRKVRRKKLFDRFDHNCMNCPIRLNLLPTDIAH